MDAKHNKNNSIKNIKNLILSYNIKFLTKFIFSILTLNKLF